MKMKKLLKRISGLIVVSLLAMFLIQVYISKKNIKSIVFTSTIPNTTPLFSSLANLNSRLHFFQPSFIYRNFWRNNSFSFRNSYSPQDFIIWEKSKVSMCEGKIVAFNKNFLLTSDMIIDRHKFSSPNKGGENLQDVKNQPESYEYFTMEMGSFRTTCFSRPRYTFDNKNHLNEWMMNLKTLNFEGENSERPFYQVDQFTIAVTRYEYVNFYHSMTDWYNAFLIMEFFNKTPHQTNILLIDTHPFGSLDPVWEHLFNSTRRLVKLPAVSHFSQLVWGILGYNSPLQPTFEAKPLPLLEEFRAFFLNAFGIKITRKPCPQINILLIWRRDFISHPRNSQGLVSRKIANEKELEDLLKKRFSAKFFSITSSQIDQLSMREQLKLIQRTHVLVGMHGAGLTHALFLNKKSALIEFFPNYYDGEHFKAIASWRNLFYFSWTNQDQNRELQNKSTIIPPKVLVDFLKSSIKSLCPFDHLKIIATN